MARILSNSVDAPAMRLAALAAIAGFGSDWLSLNWASSFAASGHDKVARLPGAPSRLTPTHGASAGNPGEAGSGSNAGRFSICHVYVPPARAGSGGAPLNEEDLISHPAGEVIRKRA